MLNSRTSDPSVTSKWSFDQDVIDLALEVDVFHLDDWINIDPIK